MTVGCNRWLDRPLIEQHGHTDEVLIHPAYSYSVSLQTLMKKANLSVESYCIGIVFAHRQLNTSEAFNPSTVQCYVDQRTSDPSTTITGDYPHAKGCRVSVHWTRNRGYIAPTHYFFVDHSHELGNVEPNVFAHEGGTLLNRRRLKKGKVSTFPRNNVHRSMESIDVFFGDW